ncbi:MAG: winged helix-turn-helix transcriptional regulator [Prevotellaceae bacterium]|jgi:Lrp/AsnC family transcriptional regulator for asnA, asnC and gidA|nr:winged helix-turn-helix transcriptional regulator [Prevotellaceae bacterium]
MEKIDCLDKKILQIISHNARIPFRDIAEECGVSRAAIHQRVQHLVDKGIIRGSGYFIDEKKLGYSICVYVGILLEKASMYRAVVEKLEQIPEIVESQYTLGNYTILVKLFAKNSADLMRILNGRIQEIEGVTATETLISLEQRINRHVPPIQ